MCSHNLKGNQKWEILQGSGVEYREIARIRKQLWETQKMKTRDGMERHGCFHGKMCLQVC